MNLNKLHTINMSAIFTVCHRVVKYIKWIIILYSPYGLSVIRMDARIA
jgi:hypothetical protein